MLFAAILSNIPVIESVGNDLVALVPWDDTDLAFHRTIDGYDSFMSKFTDVFGREVSPSVIVMNEHVIRAEQWFPAITAFRNILAISSIPRAWSEAISSNRQPPGLYYGDYFQIYPYHINADGTASAFNPAACSTDVLTKARGQNTPGLHNFSELQQFYDQELLCELLACWADRFAFHPVDETWRSTALFRSLEMAFRASLMPSDNQGSLGDYGAQVALWVSACEVLAHDQTNSSAHKVSKTLLKPCVFDSPQLNASDCPTCIDGTHRRLTLVQALYYQLNNVRNDFLHGNNLEHDDLFPWKNPTHYHPLPMLAPLIYKCALLTYLDCWSKRRSILDNDLSMHEYAERRQLDNAIYQFKPDKNGGYGPLDHLREPPTS